MSCRYNQKGPSFNAVWATLLSICTMASCAVNERVIKLRSDLVEAGVIAGEEVEAE